MTSIEFRGYINRVSKPFMFVRDILIVVCLTLHIGTYKPWKSEDLILPSREKVSMLCLRLIYSLNYVDSRFVSRDRDKSQDLCLIRHKGSCFNNVCSF